METIDVGELLYEYTVKLTGLTEYGVSFGALMAGTAPPPPEGARFDFPFEGASIGPKLKGKVTGVDYLRVRADGRFDLHIHAEITTDDGQKSRYTPMALLSRSRVAPSPVCARI